MKPCEPQPENTPLSATRRRGFSLMELLVVISIIALLVGISVPAAIKMLGRADVSKTRATLNALAAAIDEYKLKTGAVPDHTDEDINNLVVSDEDEANDPEKDTTIGFFLSRGMQTGGSTEKMIRSGVARGSLKFKRPGDTTFSSDVPDFAAASSDPALLQAYLDPENWQLHDAWDTPLRYAAKVSHDTSGGAFRDDDYLPAHPNPFFASAGPDGEWGDAQMLRRMLDGDGSLSDDDLEDAKEAQDNIYSFDIE